MCGITGFFEIHGPQGPDGARERMARIKAMTAAIAHRGPDGDGIYLSPDCRVALGHRRLAVIDLSPAAAQPMGSDDGRYQIVYNGEVYNFDVLRNELETRGIRFRSRGDTEVVLRLFEIHGTAAFAKLNGMFALAIWDDRDKRLVLARDRFGQKPLFYARTGARSALCFGSEIKALLATGQLAVTPSLHAIDHLLTLQFVPSPMTFFEGVNRLPPGHFLVAEPDKPLRIERFSPQPPARDNKIGFREAVEEVDHLLTAAVRRQLVSDVPIGIFASGGIDSTLLLAKLRELGRSDLRAFALGFREGAWNELPHATVAAEKLGIPLEPIVFEPSAFAHPDQIIAMFDEPFADVAALPTLALSRAARPKITVALTGDGGDEIFAGYEHHVAAYWVDALAPLGPARARAARLLARHLPQTTRFRSALRTAGRALDTLGCDDFAAVFTKLRANLAPDERARLWSRDLLEKVSDSDPYAALLPTPRDLDHAIGIHDAMFSDLFLMKTDLTAMSVGLECRSPFLDVPLVDFAARLPLSLFVRGVRGKAILRALVDRKVDRGLASRRKMGLSPPVDAWLRGPLAPLLRDLLLARDASTKDFVDSAEVRRLVEEHLGERANHRRVLWGLLLLETWLRRVKRHQPIATTGQWAPAS